MLSLLNGYDYSFWKEKMSVSVSIDIRLTEPKNGRLARIDIVKVLIDYGWTLYHEGLISYQPSGSKSITDWKYASLNFEDLSKIFTMKQSSHEINGVMMTWANTGIGGDFLFWPEEISNETFSLNLQAIRQKINLGGNYSITAFQWYLEKLLPPLNEAFGVESFSCQEHK